MEDVGFYQGKKSAINRARRTRKLGSKIPPPFPNGWYVLAESREVKSGCAISVDCLGENFVVFRSNKSGKVFVLDAYCPHMGANLGVGGIVRGDCVECPFHEWKFSGETGECVNIPYSKDGLAGRELMNLVHELNDVNCFAAFFLEQLQKNRRSKSGQRKKLMD